VTDLRRLGKRGSYRLGRLRAQGIVDAGPQAPIRPSFTRTYHQGRASLWLLALLAGAAAIWGGAIIGLWEAPFIVGVLAGLANSYGGFRARTMIVAVVVMAAVGWGVPLAWPAALHHQPVWATARTIAALLGLPAHALAGIGLTLLIAAAQALAGLWLGRALTPRGTTRY
jgi:hypothetical protein